jgi:hypothetical protein
MSCDCGQCRQHYRTLGIAFGIPEESEIQQAYQEAVKQWNPEFFQDFASLRADAEEHFEQIQIAFRELKEHNAALAESAGESAAVQPPSVVIDPSAFLRSTVVSEPSVVSEPAVFTQPSFVSEPAVFTQPNAVSEPAVLAQPSAVFERSVVREAAPSISFGDAPGCLVGPHFTPEAEEMIRQHLGKLGAPLAIVDLSGTRSPLRNYAQFLLLTELGIMVRDVRKIVSLLWFRDLGEVILIDKQKPGKSGMWQSLFDGGSSSQSKSVLEIYRNNGTLFYSLSSHAEDNVKKVIYDFLLGKRNQSQPLARE